ncbi:putative efflux protein, MATE family [Pelagirhabdus alkalitolerans]|uniref:Multidrug export protein MepA n=1 Tax=Pelagirhabdus alkalitolerans TaxID=1612202 RepID=A0A1G6JXA9_9BACI|nr:MATE family efflux transporter [Pelagirhabdus alkalitolerans]SDC23357.1 putative efflux protein, MATE family [Pelagirhabdus alkalitolerans]
MKNEEKSTLDIVYNRRELILFALPTILMMLFNALYMAVDGIFIARFVDQTALSALNMVFPVFGVVTAIGLMLASGGNAIVSRTLGEGDKERARKYFTLIFLVSLSLGALFSLMIHIFFDQTMAFLGATDNAELYNYTSAYARITMSFLPVMVTQFVLLTFFVTAGNPKIGLMTSILGGVTNIVLDYVFLVFLDLGLTGAAFASGLGYSVPVIVGIIYFFSKHKKELYFTKPSWDGKVIIESMGNGASEFVQSTAGAITTLAINYLMLRHVGVEGIAAVTVFFYIFYLFVGAFEGYIIGVAPLIGFGYGRKDTQRIKSIFRNSIELVSITSILMAGITLIFAPQWIALLTGEAGTEVYNIAVQGMRYGSVAYLFTGGNIFSSGLFTALSNGKISAKISFMRTFLFLLICLLILPELFGVTGIWLSIPVSEFLSILMSIYFIRKKRTNYHYY